jgi:hypothetical protein
MKKYILITLLLVLAVSCSKLSDSTPWYSSKCGDISGDVDTILFINEYHREDNTFDYYYETRSEIRIINVSLNDFHDQKSLEKYINISCDRTNIKLLCKEYCEAKRYLM